MKKILKNVTFLFLLAALVWCGTVIADRQTLRNELIRLHVVADSDSDDAQALKLKVRDAVTASLQSAMEDITDPEEAEAYLQENLTRIQSLAYQVLADAGCEDPVTVSLTEEAFDTREYDTFTLPAGVYQSLRIEIGEGEGKNWWCVVFPTLCLPATSEGFEAMAEDAGLEEALACALTGEDGYELRFYVLDLLGRVENMFFQG